MGLKKRLKHFSKVCFCCHHKFTSYEDKHIDRIDKTKDYKANNMIVLCKSCKTSLTKLKLQIWQLTFFNYFLDIYFKHVPICSRKVIVDKMRKLRRLHKMKIKEMEKYKHDE